MLCGVVLLAPRQVIQWDVRCCYSRPHVDILQQWRDPCLAPLLVHCAKLDFLSFSALHLKLCPTNPPATPTSTPQVWQPGQLGGPLCPPTWWRP